MDEFKQLVHHRVLESTPEIWVDVVHGDVSPEQAAERTKGDEPPALIERRKRLFAPPSAEQEQRTLEALLDALSTEPAARTPQAARAPRWRWWGSAVLVAACGLLVLMLRRPTEPDSLVGYELELSGGHEPGRVVMRGADPPPRARAYIEGRTISITLRPERAVTTEIGVKVFAAQGEASKVLPVTPSTEANGVVKLAATTTALGLSVGQWRLTVVVGPPGALPERPEQVVGEGRAAPYDVEIVDLEILPMPPEPKLPTP